MNINEIVKKLKADGTGETLRPVWDEEQKAVRLPALECLLDPASLAVAPLCWDRAAEEAEKRGGRLASREEMTVVCLQKDAIDALLKQRGFPVLDASDGPLWSSTIHAPGLAWCVSLRGGELTWAPIAEEKRTLIVQDYK